MKIFKYTVVVAAVLICMGAVADAGKTRIRSGDATQAENQLKQGTTEYSSVPGRDDVDLSQVNRQPAACLNATHGCFVTGGPGCDGSDTGADPIWACCESVCSYDSYCCNYSWDSICVSEAQSDANCPPIPPPPTGACCCEALLPPYNCSITEEDLCNAMGCTWNADQGDCFMGGYTYNSGTINLGISDYQYTNHTITIPDSFIINDVDVYNSISHTWIGDLEITVAHGGYSTQLMDHNCGSTDNIENDFDDEGEIPDTCPSPYGPNFVPVDGVLGGPGMSGWDGMDAQGDWDIEIYDWAGGDQGTLHYWEIQFAGDEPFCPYVPCEGGPPESPQS